MVVGSNNNITNYNDDTSSNIYMGSNNIPVSLHGPNDNALVDKARNINCSNCVDDYLNMSNTFVKTETINSFVTSVNNNSRFSSNII